MKNAKVGMQRRRFSILRKVSPMGSRSVPPKRSRKVKRFAKLDKGVGSIKEEANTRDCALSAWDMLPEPLLQQILARVLSNEPGWLGRKALFSACGTCRSWRSAGLQGMFEDLWQGSPTIAHPSQLFLMSPRPIDGGLVKCYIKREDISGGLGGPHYRFLLYLGSDHTQEGSKFLLCAVQHSWQRILVYISRTEWRVPCARLVSNLIGTHHRLLPGCSSYFPSVPDTVGIKLPNAENIGGVSYKMRMKGMMRPRRLNVVLPHPTLPSLPLEGSLLYRFSLNRNSFDIFNSQRELLQPFRMQNSVLLRDNRLEAEHEAFGMERHRRGQSQPARVLEGGEGPSGARTLKLTNKPPHWNEELKCWCLNFKGRVKLASVKNFQLMCSNDMTGRIVMQFGKVDTNTFIMDFNPEVITGIQAFAIALTSFEGRLLL